jgi:hypothetical protein
MNNFGDETGFNVIADELRVVTVTGACAHEPVPIRLMFSQYETQHKPQMEPV